MNVNLSNRHLVIAGVLVAVLLLGVWALSRDSRDPEWLRDKYGISNAFSQKIDTPDGSMNATLVPVSLADGRTAYLVVPQKGDNQLYLKDDSGLTPIESTDRALSKDQFVRSRPVIVERPVTTSREAVIQPRKRRSTTKEVMIVAGSSGAGAAIGGIAGGKKGAAVGAVSGGVAGLIYDLATRNK